MGGGGNSVNLWVGVCHWDTEPLTLHYTMITLILLRLGNKKPYPRLAIFKVEPLRRNSVKNRAISCFNGQKSGTRIIVFYSRFDK